MKNIIKSLQLCLVFSVFAAYTYGQDVKIIYQNPDFKKEGISKDFHYINKGMDISNFQKIATMKGIGNNSGKQTLDNIFNQLWESANKLGANSFRIDNYSNNNSDSVVVVLSVYKLTPKELETNEAFFPRNMIYVFGDLNIKRHAGKRIKLNGEKVVLLPLEYVSYQNKVGKEATVSIGGFSGSKVWIKWQENRLSKYLSLKGLGIGPGPMYYGQVGISITTGRLFPVDIDFGQFLVEILHEKKFVDRH